MKYNLLFKYKFKFNSIFYRSFSHCLTNATYMEAKPEEKVYKTPSLTVDALVTK